MIKITTIIVLHNSCIEVELEMSLLIDTVLRNTGRTTESVSVTCWFL